MIATVDQYARQTEGAETSSTSEPDDSFSWHDGFLDLLPRIVAHAGRQLRHLASDARQDAIAEVVANSCLAYRRLVELGKTDVAFAAPLARYAIANVRRGRRVGTRQNINDVLSPYCQHSKGLTRWTEIAVEDRSATPADVAAFRVDFAEWLQQLPATHRHIAETLAIGETTQDTASSFKVSPGRISQLRRELKDSWDRFQSVASAMA